MAEVKRFPLLTVEEEQALLARVQENGDPAAKRELVERNLRLSVKLARQYGEFTTGDKEAFIMDLIQQGNMGLMMAVSKFDAKFSTKFSTYAQYWIKAYIHKYLISSSRLIRIGTTNWQRKMFYKLGWENTRLMAKGLSNDERVTELAKIFNVTEDEVREMQIRLNRHAEVSTSTPLAQSSDDNPFCYGDLLEGSCPDADVALDAARRRETLISELKKFEKTLNARDLAVFREHIMTTEPVTLATLGKRFGVARERIRQLKTRIIHNISRRVKWRLSQQELASVDLKILESV
jgi:RNA polymerase sigma-32 factor